MNKENKKKDLLEENIKLELDVEEEEFEDFLDEMEEVEDNETIRTTDERENAIEWYNGRDTITVTFSQRRFINKINNLAQKYPNEVKIDRINPDGTMLAHIPLSYLKIQKPRTLTEEEKEKARERLAQYRKPKQ